MENIQRVYVYKVDHDLGVNPNPFGKYCTLGSCKPALCSGIYNSYGRDVSNKGVWVIGIGGANLGKAYGKVICAMQVTEAMPREEYKKDVRFSYKVHRNVGKDWHKKNFKGWKNNNNWVCCGDQPANNQYVLVSDRFKYWGHKACEQEEIFIDLLQKPKDPMYGHRVNFSVKVFENIKSWLNDNFKNEGCLERPVFSSPDFKVPTTMDIAAITKQANSSITAKIEDCNKKKANTDILKGCGCK